MLQLFSLQLPPLSSIISTLLPFSTLLTLSTLSFSHTLRRKKKLKMFSLSLNPDHLFSHLLSYFEKEKKNPKTFFLRSTVFSHLLCSSFPQSRSSVSHLLCSSFSQSRSSVFEGKIVSVVNTLHFCVSTFSGRDPALLPTEKVFLFLFYWFIHVFIF